MERGRGEGRTPCRTAGRRTSSLADPRSALSVARKLGRGELKPARARLAAGRGGEAPGRSRSATCSRAICPRTRAGGGSSARIPGPGPFWPSRAMPAGARSCSGRRRSTAAAATRSATGARRSGRTCRPSGNCARGRTCWRASWSRRAGSSRSTPPIVVQHGGRPVVHRSAGKRDEKEVVLARRPKQGDRPRGQERGGTAAVADCR